MQKSVQDFIDKYKLRNSAEIRFIDLVSEIGELGKEILNSTCYGKNDFVKTLQIIDETGDCLFSLLALCYELEIDANEALQKSLSKYEMRFTNKGNISSDR